MPEVCTNGCGKPGKFLCSLCHVARYCSGQCQREHWKRGGHKTDCLGRQTDREAAVAAVAKTSSDYYATDIISRAAFGMAAFRDFKQKVAEANEAEVPFLRLPNTVLATIFEVLDNRDLVAITAVCSRFRRICQGLVQIQDFPPGWPWDPNRRRQKFARASVDDEECEEQPRDPEAGSKAVQMVGGGGWNEVPTAQQGPETSKHNAAARGQQPTSGAGRQVKFRTGQPRGGAKGGRR
eukprot:m.16695 g.16695  ORF g.16695 m.16695 type:complete len:237 (-) comp5081_c0_seq1:147-857(-)